ncbi:MAG TPA: hypothetical protein VF929_03290 [Gemmatimonadaceae bacterium]
MSILTGTPMGEAADPAVQGSTAAQLSALQQHEGQVQLRLSDIQVQLDQLREQQALARPSDRVQFNEALANAKHEFAATMLDYEATHAKVESPFATTRRGVEAIAIEVERIGEAERFSAKLLSKRRPAPDALASARREVGTITPH